MIMLNSQYFYLCTEQFMPDTVIDSFKADPVSTAFKGSRKSVVLLMTL